MLVLRRHSQEEIYITIKDELIKVIILSNDSQSVRLGFVASENVKIDRREIYDRKVKEKKSLLLNNRNEIQKDLKK